MALSRAQENLSHLANIPVNRKWDFGKKSENVPVTEIC